MPARLHFLALQGRAADGCVAVHGACAASAGAALARYARALGWKGPSAPPHALVPPACLAPTCWHRIAAPYPCLPADPDRPYCQVYRVAAGDTVASVADKFGMKEKELSTLNSGGPGCGACA